MRKITFAANEYYHIYDRGVDRRDVFVDDTDRMRFINTLYVLNNFLRIPIRFDIVELNPISALVPQDPMVEIAAACLMSNHYHFLVRPLSDRGISRFFHKVGVSYTKYFNARHERSGSLFESTFKAKHVDRESYAFYLTKYIHFNPGSFYDNTQKHDDKRSLLEFLEIYPWSTFSNYVGQSSKFDRLVSLSFRDTILGMDANAYRAYISEMPLDVN